MTNHKKRIIGIALIAGLMLLALAISVSAFSWGKYEKIKAANGVVSVPVSALSDGKARFYRFEDNDKEIAFLVVMAPDGSYRTAFDACDVCYREKKGYNQKGDDMVCNNCNRKFAIKRIGPHEIGGCNPSYFPYQMSGNRIVINVSDLKSGARFF
jgi:uncharacterized membrane protein